MPSPIEQVTPILRCDDALATAEWYGVQAQDMPWGMRELHLTDPAGNRIRVGSGVGT